MQSQFLILSKRLVWNKECKASSLGVEETGLEQRLQSQFFRSVRDWFGTKNARQILDYQRERQDQRIQTQDKDRNSDLKRM